MLVVRLVALALTIAAVGACLAAPFALLTNWAAAFGLIGQGLQFGAMAAGLWALTVIEERLRQRPPST